jgi:hypothetical protein
MRRSGVRISSQAPRKDQFIRSLIPLAGSSDFAQWVRACSSALRPGATLGSLPACLPVSLPACLPAGGRCYPDSGEAKRSRAVAVVRYRPGGSRLTIDESVTSSKGGGRLASIRGHSSAMA